ncbi:protein tudor-like [Tubulanus polymorphus]|uniref:protein tudor-like n=1 Tax=Tubulanus polymorphus TaxID=672921 RepID=UPI003DA3795F
MDSFSYDQTPDRVPLLQPEVPSDEEGYVVFSLSPGKFYIQLAETENQLNELRTKIDENFSYGVGVSPTGIKVGSLCMAVYLEDFYRARVLRQPTANEVEVFFIDYGNTEMNRVTELRIMPDSLKTYPAQSIECSLFHHSGYVEYPKDVIAYFRALVNDEPVTVRFFKETSIGYEVDILVKNGGSVIAKLDAKFPTLQSHVKQMINLGREDIVDYNGTYSTLDVQVGSVENVSVTHVNNPTKFYCQLGKNETVLNSMMDDIDTFCSSSGEIPITVSIGMPVIGQYSQDDGWYRAIVKGTNNDEVEVHYVDYGDAETIDKNKLRKLNAEFLQLPQQIIPCSLYNVSSRESWPKELCDKFENIVLEKDCRAEFVSLNRGVYNVMMTTVDGVNINEIFQNIPATSPARANQPQRAMPEPSVRFEKMLIATGEYKDLYIVHIEDPTDFWCQLMENSHHLKELMDEMQIVYNAVSATVNEPSVSMACCAKYYVDDLWYRAEIIKITPDGITVQFVDYGNCECVTLDQLKKIRPEHVKLPTQGIPCKLQNLRPARRNDQWSAEGIDHFVELTDEKSLVGSFIGLDDDRKYSIVLLDPKESIQNIRDKMIQSGHGETITKPGKVSVSGASSVSSSHGSTPPRIRAPATVTNGYAIGSADDASAVNEWRQNRVSPSSPSEYKQMPIRNGQTSEVCITWVESATQFWCQTADEHSRFISMMGSIQNCYQTKKDTLLGARIGSPCIAMFTDDCWYRASIISKSGAGYEVLFVDYGNKEVIPESKVRTVIPEFLEIPRMAVQCYLKDAKAVNPKLSPSEQEKFQQIMSGSLMCTFITTGPDDGYLVGLKSNGRDVKDDLLKFRIIEGPASVMKACYKPPTVLRTVGSTFSATVSFIISPTQFWVQCNSESDKLNQLMDDIDAHYSSSSTQQISNVDVGLACVAKYSEDDGWYRAEVTAVDGQSVKVNYVDYGNSADIAKSDLRDVDSRFLDLPKQAIECCLDGIHNPSREAIAKFEDIASDEGVIVTVKNGSSGRLNVELVGNEASSVVLDMNSEVRRLCSSAVPKLPDPTLPSTSVDGYISHVNTPGDFYIQLVQDETQLTDMFSELQTHYGSRSNPLNLTSVGALCAAEFSEDDTWYRAKIQAINGNLAQVLFFDYGNMEEKAINELETLSDDFLQRPPYAYHCTFNKNRSATSWNPEDIACLKKYMETEVMNVAFVGDSSPYSVRIQVDGQDLGALFEYSTPPAPTTPIYPAQIIESGRQQGYISHVESLDEFYVQLATQEHDLDNVTTNMESLCAHGGGNHLKVFDVGTPCCAEFSEDEAWYRAVITDYVDNEKVNVRFVDHGNSEVKLKAGLKELHPAVSSYPPFAIQCTIGIKGNEKSKSKLIEQTEDKALSIDFVSTTGAPYKVRLFDGADDIGSFFSARPKVAVTSYPERLVPKTGVKCYMSQVASVHDFYVQLSEESCNLEELMVEISSAYNAQSASLVNPSAGSPCVAQFSEDEAWYRAIVKKISGNTATVQFIDYGNCEEKDIHQLKELNAQIAKAPAFAINCSLGSSIPDTSDNTDKLFRATDTKELFATFNNNIAPYELEIFDGDTDIKQLFTGSSVGSVNESAQRVVEQGEFYPSRTLTSDKQTGFITHVESPREFYIQLESESDQLDKITDELADKYSSLDELAYRLYSPVINQVCAAKFSEDDCWYRSEIIEMAGDTATVRFVDYGNSEKQNITELKSLFVELNTVSKLALTCSVNAGGRQFTTEDADNLLSATDGKTLTVEFVSNAQPYTVKLYLESEDITSQFEQDELAHIPIVELGSNFHERTLDVDSFEGYICHCDSLEQFYIQMTSEETMLSMLMDKLGQFYEKLPKDQQVLQSPAVNSPCVAQYSDDDTWYRAILLSVADDATGEVEFVDYGNSEMKPLAELKTLSPIFAQHPKFALHCTVGSGQYTTEQDDEFCEITQDKLLEVKLLTKIPPFEVSLLCDGVDLTAKYRAMAVTENTNPAAPSSVIDYPERSLELCSLDGYVVHVESSCEIYVHLAAEENSLDKLMEDLKAYYESDTSNYGATLEIGSVCATKFSDDDEWYRGQITKISDTKITVQFVDYGNCEEKSSSDLKALMPQFLELPKLAIPCSLGNKSLTEEQTEEFIAETSDKVLEIQFTSEVVPYTIKISFESVNIIDKFLMNELKETTLVSIKERTIEPGRSVGYISHFHSMKEFYVQLANEEDQLDSLMDRLNHHYGSVTAETNALTETVLGVPCVARYSEDERWYRGTIESVNEDMAIIHFIDYGNKEEKSIADLKSLSVDFVDFTPFAIKCMVDVENENTDTCDKFHEKTSEQELQIQFDTTGEPCLVKVFIDGVDVVSSLMDPVDSSSVEVDVVDTPEKIVSAVEFDTVDSSSIAFEANVIDASESAVLAEENAGTSNETFSLKSLSEALVNSELNGNKINKGPKLPTLDVDLSQPYKVCISHINTPADFYMQLSEKSDVVDELVDKLQIEYCEGGTKIVDVGLGRLCCAVYDDSYYRGIVTRFTGAKTEVLFVDYGNSALINTAEICELKEKFLDIPILAIHCKMAGLVDENRSWSVEDITAFENQVHDQELTAVFESMEVPFAVRLSSLNDDIIDISNTIPTLKSAETEPAIVNGKSSTSPENDEFELKTKLKSNYSHLNIASGSKLRVTIGNIKTPSQFWVQLAESGTVIEEMNVKLFEFYESCDKTVFIEQPEIGQVCAAKFFEDGNWYRAIVKSFNDEKIEVFFVDYGNTAKVDHVYQLKPSYLQTPAQAIECFHLCLKSQKGAWTDEAVSCFSELVADKVLVCEFAYKGTDSDMYMVHLLDMGIPVAKSLAEAGMALYIEKEPSFLDDSAVLAGDSGDASDTAGEIIEGILDACQKSVESPMATDVDHSMKCTEMEAIKDDLKSNEDSQLESERFADESSGDIEIENVQSALVDETYEELENDQNNTQSNIEITHDFDNTTIDIEAVDRELAGMVTIDEIQEDVFEEEKFVLDEELMAEIMDDSRHSDAVENEISVSTDGSDKNIIADENAATPEIQITEAELISETNNELITLDTVENEEIEPNDNDKGMAETDNSSQVDTADQIQCTVEKEEFEPNEDLNSMVDRTEEETADCDEETPSTGEKLEDQDPTCQSSKEECAIITSIEEVNGDQVIPPSVNNNEIETVKSDTISRAEDSGVEINTSPTTPVSEEASSCIITPNSEDDDKQLILNIENFKSESVDPSVVNEIAETLSEVQINEFQVPSAIEASNDSDIHKADNCHVDEMIGGWGMPPVGGIEWKESPQEETGITMKRWVPEDFVNCIVNYVEIELNEDSELLVTFIANGTPNDFAVHPKASHKLLKKLVTKMKQHVCSENSIQAEKFEVGQPCLFTSDAGESWCRGIVMAFNDDNTYQVKSVDYGRIEEKISIDYMRLIPKMFMEMPPQGLRCSLYGIENKVWSDDDKSTFLKLCRRKLMMSVNKKLEGAIPYSVYLYPQTDDDTSINCQLVKEGIASVITGSELEIEVDLVGGSGDLNIVTAEAAGDDSNNEMTEESRQGSGDAPQADSSQDI